MNVRYVVVDEHTLGYIFEDQPNNICILHGSVERGSPYHWVNGSFLRSRLHVIRDATRYDFMIYRVVVPRDLNI